MGILVEVDRLIISMDRLIISMNRLTILMDRLMMSMKCCVCYVIIELTVIIYATLDNHKMAMLAN